MPPPSRLAGRLSTVIGVRNPIRLMLSINSVTVASRSCRRRLPISISLMGTIIGPLRRDVAAPMENGRVRLRAAAPHQAWHTAGGAGRDRRRAHGDDRVHRSIRIGRERRADIPFERDAGAAGAVRLDPSGLCGYL